jgi:pyrophosphate--fructose-6-phosphate 1-phosphotransferase
VSDTHPRSSSPLQAARLEYAPRFPTALADLARLTARAGERLEPAGDPAQKAALAAQFPRTWGQPALAFQPGDGQAPAARAARLPRVGVVLSGGPAPGGHNVIWGLLDALATLGAPGTGQPELTGFLGGPAGILDDRVRPVTSADFGAYRNTGGFDLLGSGRTKIESPAQLERCRAVLEARGLDALVIVGGDDSNTNAAVLAEHLARHGSPVRVVGVPKTIDGDLKNEWVETSFGFDTAVRVYAELVANVARDTLSARKYYHFVRLMGRSASHITVECALQTRPNVALVAEEIAARGQTLQQIVEELGAVIKRRAEAGKNFGMVLVPEGLIEFIPEMQTLIAELNQILVEHKDYVATLNGFTDQSDFVHRKLGKDASYTFSRLPLDLQRQLLHDRDPHGNVIVSQIETERLLIALLEAHLDEEKAEGRFAGKFGHQRHFLGYEGRCSAPTNFDADYGYALGRCAAALVAGGANGYMAVVTGLAGPRDAWRAVGVPLVAMLSLERRHGRDKPVIRKGLVDLEGAAMRHLVAARARWADGEHYRAAGPIQYFGPAAVCDKVPASLALEQGVFSDDGPPWW